jgi:ferredoxin
MPAKVNVQWIKEKCPKPQDCGKCAEVCPSTIFCIYAKNRVRYKASENYVVSPSYQYLCTACRKCVEVCPNQALKVEVKK